MRVFSEILAASFERARLDQDALHAALRQMCPAALKAYNAEQTRAMRAAWSSNNPTRFCCYFVSEMVYWYCAPEGSKPMALTVPGDDTPHRYVEWPDGSIVDLTCDQFDDYTQLNYTLARRRMFLQTGGVGPSKRAQLLASLLGLQRG